MVDYYTNVCFEFPCSPKHAEQLDAVLDLAGKVIYDIDYPEVLKSIWETEEDLFRDVIGEPSDDILSFGIDETSYDNNLFSIVGHAIELDALAKVIQTIVKPITPIIMTYAHDSSRPVLNGYGGGVCVIFSDKIMCANTETLADAIIKAYPHDVQTLSIQI